VQLSTINRFRKELQGDHFTPLSEEDLAQILAQPNVYLVTVDERAMVFCYFVETLTRKVLLFDELIVDESVRKQGFGRWLLYNIEQLAQELGADCIECTVKENNTPALGMYKGCGYKDRNNRALRKWR
jgi:ribosomal protein S18 acetylase RimI-like enzyme